MTALIAGAGVAGYLLAGVVLGRDLERRETRRRRAPAPWAACAALYCIPLWPVLYPYVRLTDPHR